MELNYVMRKNNTTKRENQRIIMQKLNYLELEKQCLWHKSPSITKESSCYEHCHVSCDGKIESCDTKNYIGLRDIPSHIAKPYIKKRII